MRIERYTHDLKEDWNKFIRESRNGTFHLTRAFIEYHGDRFTDHSLIVRDDKNEIVLAIPLHIEKDQAVSHAGLSYAGFVFSQKHRIEENLTAQKEVCRYLFEQAGCKKFRIKSIPHIYHRLPAEDDLYFFYHAGAKLVARNVNPVISSSVRLPYQERRKRAMKRAKKEGVIIRETDDLRAYWSILENLLASYGSKPVHTLSEINHLKEAFPGEIRLFGSFYQDRMISGVLIFESETVAKMQYIAADNEGKEIGALDLLMDHLIHEVYQSKPWIDFGTSSMSGGAALSLGISNQKEGLGGRTTIHDHYEIDLEAVANADFTGRW